MAKTAAVLKKVDISKKSTASKAKPKAKKPVLKVVKPAKPAAKKATKPAAKPVKKPVAKLVKKPEAPKKAAPKAEVKKETKRDFRVGMHVVYPTHGVGKIVGEETQDIGGIMLKLLVIMFEKDRMTLRVPVTRAQAAGLRHISGNDHMKRVFETLKSRARASRGMWSRRAQEYETKINSGDIILISEVVRDLHPNVDQAERSYSERMIYENALTRLVGEYAAAEGMNTVTAQDKLLKLLRSKLAA